MFRIQDNVPEVYINESRDFQLISRLYDVLFSGNKYNIDSMVNLLDATLAKDSMLQLLSTKVGFFPRIDIDANVLKYIIASFPYILKYKGSLVGIQYAVNAILKAENNPDAVGTPHIKVVNKKDPEDKSIDEYTIYIYTTIDIYNKHALSEVLRYVIPVGSDYKVLKYFRGIDALEHPTILAQTDKLNVLKAFPVHAGMLRGSGQTYSDLLSNGNPTAGEATHGFKKSEFISEVVGSYSATQIVGSQDKQYGLKAELNTFPTENVEAEEAGKKIVVSEEILLQQPINPEDGTKIDIDGKLAKQQESNEEGKS